MVTLTLSLAGKNSHFGATENNTRLLPSPQVSSYPLCLFVVMVYLWLFISLHPMPPRSLGGLFSGAGLGLGWTPAAAPPLPVTPGAKPSCQQVAPKAWKLNHSVPRSFSELLVGTHNLAWAVLGLGEDALAWEPDSGLPCCCPFFLV